MASSIVERRRKIEHPPPAAQALQITDLPCRVSQDTGIWSPPSATPGFALPSDPAESSPRPRLGGRNLAPLGPRQLRPRISPARCRAPRPAHTATRG